LLSKGKSRSEMSSRRDLAEVGSTYRDRVAKVCWMASLVQKLEQVDIVRLVSEVLAH